MKSLVVLAALAGCYTPSIPTGAPCSATEPCPRSQQCVAGACSVDGDGGIDTIAGDGPIDGGIPADWWDPAWKYRRPITINAGADLSTRTFPVLVRLDSQFDYANTLANGDDVRFVIAPGKELSFDIDTWTLTGTTTIWVSVPKLDAAPATIWMYYGNPAATAAGTEHAVWADQTAVYHLNSYTDATGNNHGGTTFGTAPSGVSGKISSGRSFGGAGGITLSNPGQFNFTTAMSLTLWARVDAFDQNFETLVAKGNTTWRLHRNDATNKLAFDTNTTVTNSDQLSSNTTFVVGDWHQIAVVFDGSKKSFYIDGVLDAEKPYTTALVGADVPIGLGYNPAIGTSRFFTGVLDEVRIMSAARDATWIATEYRTVVDTTFAVIGAAEHIE